MAAHRELNFENNAYRPAGTISFGIKWKDFDYAINTMQKLIDLINTIVRGAGFAWEDLDEQLENASLAFWEQPVVRP